MLTSSVAEVIQKSYIIALSFESRTIPLYVTSPSMSNSLPITGNTGMKSNGNSVDSSTSVKCGSIRIALRLPGTFSSLPAHLYHMTRFLLDFRDFSITTPSGISTRSERNPVSPFDNRSSSSGISSIA